MREKERERNGSWSEVGGRGGPHSEKSQVKVAIVSFHHLGILNAANRVVPPAMECKRWPASDKEREKGSEADHVLPLLLPLFNAPRLPLMPLAAPGPPREAPPRRTPFRPSSVASEPARLGGRELLRLVGRELAPLEAALEPPTAPLPPTEASPLRAARAAALRAVAVGPECVEEAAELDPDRAGRRPLCGGWWCRWWWSGIIF